MQMKQLKTQTTRVDNSMTITPRAISHGARCPLQQTSRSAARRGAPRLADILAPGQVNKIKLASEGLCSMLASINVTGAEGPPRLRLIPFRPSSLVPSGPVSFRPVPSQEETNALASCCAGQRADHGREADDESGAWQHHFRHLLLTRALQRGRDALHAALRHEVRESISTPFSTLHSTNAHYSRQYFYFYFPAHCSIFAS